MYVLNINLFITRIINFVDQQLLIKSDLTAEQLRSKTVQSKFMIYLIFKLSKRTETIDVYN